MWQHGLCRALRRGGQSCFESEISEANKKRDSFNRKVVSVKAACFAIIITNETSRFFRAGILVDTVTMLVSCQIPVRMAVVLFVLPVNVEMGVSMGVLVGVDQAAVPMFMGMEMGMDVEIGRAHV